MSNSSNSNGVGFNGLLLIAFIVLKLTGVIDWSWWWVMAPLWIGVSIVVLVAVVIVLVRKPWRGGC